MRWSSSDSDSLSSSCLPTSSKSKTTDTSARLCDPSRRCSTQLWGSLIRRQVDKRRPPDPMSCICLAVPEVEPPLERMSIAAVRQLPRRGQHRHAESAHLHPGRHVRQSQAHGGRGAHQVPSQASRHRVRMERHSGKDHVTQALLSIRSH